ncbi:MAG UNVERIFIED_CONTAM: hypothetical protein LVR18_34490 [Planctomycetaceae bacterium]|jgi:hypothetical protein
MKKILLSAVLLASACSAADAGDSRGCFLFGRRTKTTTTQWYRAKDGTVRKMLPYWDAMHRAEDADKLETELQKSRPNSLQPRPPTHKPPLNSPPPKLRPPPCNRNWKRPVLSSHS